jgi:hypothetical protein
VAGFKVSLRFVFETLKPLKPWNFVLGL